MNDMPVACQNRGETEPQRERLDDPQNKTLFDGGETQGPALRGNGRRKASPYKTFHAQMPVGAVINLPQKETRSAVSRNSTHECGCKP